MIMDRQLLEENVRKYLNSKNKLGGRYGLTISDEKFVPDLINVILVSEIGGQFVAPPEEPVNPGFGNTEVR